MRGTCSIFDAKLRTNDDVGTIHLVGAYNYSVFRFGSNRDIYANIPTEMRFQ